MSLTPERIARTIIDDSKTLITGQSVVRINKCLEILTEEQVWKRPNSETVSVGNLILHLCGNVRQWITAGLGGANDIREREQEFSEVGPISIANLKKLLEETLTKAVAVLDAFNPTDILAPRTIQGDEVTPIYVILKVTEHFSYHTGQIAYVTKATHNVDLAYFKESN